MVSGRARSPAADYPVASSADGGSSAETRPPSRSSSITKSGTSARSNCPPASRHSSLTARAMGMRPAIRSVVGHRVEGIDQPDDPGTKRNGLAAQPVRVAAPVPALVVMADDRRERAGRRQWLADPLADLGMPAHQVPFLAVERRRLGQDSLGHPDLADVVEQGAVGDRLEVEPVETRLRAQPGGQVGQPLAMALGASGPWLRPRWRGPRPRCAPRPSGQAPGASRKALRIRASSSGWRNGLLRKSSAPASSPSTTSSSVDRPVSRMIGTVSGPDVGTEPTSDLVAVQPRQTDVEQHEVRRMLADRQQCRLAVTDGLGPIALALEDPLQQRSVARGRPRRRGRADGRRPSASRASRPARAIKLRPSRMPARLPTRFAGRRAEALSSASSSVSQPWRTANVTAWVRLGTPSLCRMLDRWFLIVCSLTSSSSPTSRLRRPAGDVLQDRQLARRQRDARWLVGAPEAVAEPLHDPVDKVGPADDLVLERVLTVRDAADDRDELGWLGDRPRRDRSPRSRSPPGCSHHRPRDRRRRSPKPGASWVSRRAAAFAVRLVQLDVDDEDVGGVVPRPSPGRHRPIEPRRRPPCRVRCRGRRGSRGRRARGARRARSGWSRGCAAADWRRRLSIEPPALGRERGSSVPGRMGPRA